MDHALWPRLDQKPACCRIPRLSCEWLHLQEISWFSSLPLIRDAHVFQLTRIPRCEHLLTLQKPSANMGQTRLLSVWSKCSRFKKAKKCVPVLALNNLGNSFKRKKNRQLGILYLGRPRLSFYLIYLFFFNFYTSVLEPKVNPRWFTAYR